MTRTQGSEIERDALDLLAEDHKRAQKLFKDFEKVDRTDEEALREIVETACIEVQIHSLLEEEIFYPAVRGRVENGDRDAEDILNKSQVEHEMVDELIAKLHDLEPADPMYCACFAVLCDHVKHHIREEERALFPALRKVAGPDVARMADDMRRRREELLSEIESEEDIEAATNEDELEGSEPFAGEDDGEDAQEQVDVSRTRH